MFGVECLAVKHDGSLVLGGPAALSAASGGPANIYVNSLTLAPAPVLRIDAVENAASLLDVPLSAGETIIIPASKQPKFKAGKGLKDAVN